MFVVRVIRCTPKYSTTGPKATPGLSFSKTGRFRCMLNAEEWAAIRPRLYRGDGGCGTKGAMKNFAIAEIGCATALLALLVTPGTANMDHKPHCACRQGRSPVTPREPRVTPLMLPRRFTREMLRARLVDRGCLRTLPGQASHCRASTLSTMSIPQKTVLRGIPFAGTEKSWPADTFDISFAQVSFPSTVLLFGAGLLALVGFRKRFNK